MVFKIFFAFPQNFLRICEHGYENWVILISVQEFFENDILEKFCSGDIYPCTVEIKKNWCGKWVRKGRFFSTMQFFLKKSVFSEKIIFGEHDYF